MSAVGWHSWGDTVQIRVGADRIWGDAGRRRGDTLLAPWPLTSHKGTQHAWEAQTLATIESYFLADGSKRYRVRYRTPERRQTDKRGFKTKHEATEFAASVEVAKLQGLYVQPSHGRLLTGQWVVDWLAGRGDLARSSQVRYEGIINEHIVPKWGKVALADVDPRPVGRGDRRSARRRGGVPLPQGHGVARRQRAADAVEFGRHPG